MSKVEFEFHDDILEFNLHKTLPDGRGGEYRLEAKALNHFIENFSNFYLSDSIGVLKDVILEVSLTWGNGKSQKWGILSRLDFGSNMVLPNIDLTKIEDVNNQDLIKVYIQFNGKFSCKFSPSKTLIEEHKGWGNSTLDLTFNFRSNFKKANNIEFGNVYCIIKDVQNQYNFVTDFN
jgi:hypothetical protein